MSGDEQETTDDHHIKDLKKGYSFLMIGLIFSVLVSGFRFVNNIRKILETEGGIMISSGLFLNFIGLIEIVLIIVGVYLIYVSREYFVGKQERNIEISAKILLIWIVLLFITVLITYLRFVLEDFIDFGSSANIFSIPVITGVFIGLSVSLIYIFLTKELVSKKIEYMMWSGLGVKFSVSLFALILLIGGINILDLTRFNDLEMFVLIRDLTLFGNLMILIGIVRVYLDRKWRSQRVRKVSKNIDE